MLRSLRLRLPSATRNAFRLTLHSSLVMTTNASSSSVATMERRFHREVQPDSFDPSHQDRQGLPDSRSFTGTFRTMLEPYLLRKSPMIARPLCVSTAISSEPEHTVFDTPSREDLKAVEVYTKTNIRGTVEAACQRCGVCEVSRGNFGSIAIPVAL